MTSLATVENPEGKNEVEKEKGTSSDLSFVGFFRGKIFQLRIRSKLRMLTFCGSLFRFSQMIFFHLELNRRHKPRLK